jgi:hypothetical protein
VNLGPVAVGYECNSGEAASIKAPQRVLDELMQLPRLLWTLEDYGVDPERYLGFFKRGTRVKDA